MNVGSEVGQGSTFTFTLPRNDHNVVFDRYATRVVALSDSLSYLSYITAVIPPGGGKQIAEDVDEYLQRSVRTQDLVLQTSDHEWLVAISCPETEAASAIDRLNAGWQDYARNYPDCQLPALQLTHRGTWPLSTGLNQLQEQFRALISQHGDNRPRLGKVLVVDDDPEVITCLGVRLKLAGYEMLKAADGAQGLASLVKHRPDAVVLDVRMPTMDGIEVLRAIRSNESIQDTPVVVLSANIREQQRALRAGANYFLSKPYDAGDVISAIEYSMQDATDLPVQSVAAHAY